MSTEHLPEISRPESPKILGYALNKGKFIAYFREKFSFLRKKESPFLKTYVEPNFVGWETEVEREVKKGIKGPRLLITKGIKGHGKNHFFDQIAFEMQKLNKIEHPNSKMYHIKLNLADFFTSDQMKDGVSVEGFIKLLYSRLKEIPEARKHFKEYERAIKAYNNTKEAREKTERAAFEKLIMTSGGTMAEIAGGIFPAGEIFKSGIKGATEAVAAGKNFLNSLADKNAKERRDMAFDAESLKESTEKLIEGLKSFFEKNSAIISMRNLDQISNQKVHEWMAENFIKPILSSKAKILLTISSSDSNIENYLTRFSARKEASYEVSYQDFNRQFTEEKFEALLKNFCGEDVSAQSKIQQHTKLIIKRAHNIPLIAKQLIQYLLNEDNSGKKSFDDKISELKKNDSHTNGYLENYIEDTLRCCGEKMMDLKFHFYQLAMLAEYDHEVLAEIWHMKEDEVEKLMSELKEKASFIKKGGLYQNCIRDLFRSNMIHVIKKEHEGGNNMDTHIKKMAKTTMSKRVKNINEFIDGRPLENHGSDNSKKAPINNDIRTLIKFLEDPKNIDELKYDSQFSKDVFEYIQANFFIEPQRILHLLTEEKMNTFKDTETFYKNLKALKEEFAEGFEEIK